MTEIHKNLFVGNETEYVFKVKNQEGWGVIHACKEPCNRQVLMMTCHPKHQNYFKQAELHEMLDISLFNKYKL